MSSEDVFLKGKLPMSSENFKEKMSEFTNVKNLHFMLGAGVSSGAVPNMAKMNEEITNEIKESEELSIEEKKYFEEIRKSNMEMTLGLLYSQRFYLNEKNKSKVDETTEKIVNKLANLIEDRLYFKINVDLDSSDVQRIIELYKQFYQKVSLRNKDLSRINIFTTNNDLLSEKALDDLNINYNNGFGGGLKRVFNPARFNFTFSKKIDSNMEKFEPLDNMVYLYKLHGSISWIEKEDNYLFNIQEVPVIGGSRKKDLSHVLIYPTPIKQNQSLGAPYSDLIRHFQTNLLKPNSILFVVGYSFSDEHLNNIIYQSLASNSSLSVVILGDHSKNCPLTSMEDNRIYQVYTKGLSGKPIHYFERFVQELLPVIGEDKEKKLLEEFVQGLRNVNNKKDKI